MLELARPWALLFVPLPLPVMWLARPLRRRLGSVRIPFFHEVAAVLGLTLQHGAMVLRGRPIERALVGAMWLCVVTALARPEWVGPPIEHHSAVRDLILAVDISESMKQPAPGRDGVRADRLAAAKRVLVSFIEARRDDRVGVIAFGSKAYLLVPLTRDLDAAQALLRGTAAGAAGPHTALGDAIGLAIRTFESSHVDERLLVLLTDGVDTGSRMAPHSAAEIARRRGIRIVTIGIGDPAARAAVPVDFSVLKRIAEITGGRFFQAEDEGGLAAAYAEINTLLPRRVVTRSERPRHALGHWPACTAASLGLVLMLASWWALRRSRPA